MLRIAKALWQDESAQGLAEYALLLGLIVIGVVAFIAGMGESIETIFSEANEDLKSAANNAGGDGN